MKTRSIKDVEHDYLILLGRKLRETRIRAGFSMCDMGDFLEKSTQQVQKYEKGLNRIPFTSLTRWAAITKNRLEYFYDNGNIIPLPEGKERLIITAMSHLRSLRKEDQKLMIQLMRSISDIRQTVA